MSIFWRALWLYLPNLDGVVLPFETGVCHGTLLQPQVKSAECVPFIHFAKERAVGITGIGLYPATEAEGLIPFRRLHAFYVDETVALDSKGLARLAGDRASAAFPFDLILLVHKFDALAVLEFIERKMSQQSGWFIWLGVHIFCGFGCPFRTRPARLCGGRRSFHWQLSAWPRRLGAWRLSLLMTSTIGGALPPRVCFRFGVVVEEREKFVVFLVRYGILLVAVALGAFDAETKEDIAGGFHTIDHVFHAVFLYDQAAFIGGAVVD